MHEHCSKYFSMFVQQACFKIIFGKPKYPDNSCGKSPFEDGYLPNCIYTLIHASAHDIVYQVQYTIQH